MAETWGKPMKGLAYLEKAIKLGLDAVQLFTAKDGALLEFSWLEQAFITFQQALSLKSDLMDGVLQMGMVCECKGRS